MEHDLNGSWAGTDIREHPDLFTFDAKELRIPDKAHAVFADVLDVTDDVKNSPEYGEALARRLANELPDADAFARMIRAKIDGGLRFAIVDGFGFEQLEPRTRDAFILAMCSLVGTPTKTDQVEGKILWDVTPREYVDHANTTFSEHSGEAAFHTDSQFFAKPEKYFSLWSLKHAEDGGGINGILDARMATRKLVESAAGIEAMIQLAGTELPFRVPTVFTAQRSDDAVEVLMAPVFAATPYVRYRKDTLEKGLQAKGMNLDPTIAKALGAFEKILEREDLVLHHFLREGQALFANNHELLHNRSSFVDQRRHLIRVRMNRRLEA